jgi:hypothetical protein
MKERRKYERFPLTVPARMERMSSDQKEIFDLETQNISACGAFINTTEQFPEGTRFELSLIVTSKIIKELTGAKSLIRSEGDVVRCTPKGLAINFDRKCHIMSLKCL